MNSKKDNFKVVKYDIFLIVFYWKVTFFLIQGKSQSLFQGRTLNGLFTSQDFFGIQY